MADPLDAAQTADRAFMSVARALERSRLSLAIQAFVAVAIAMGAAVVLAGRAPDAGIVTMTVALALTAAVATHRSRAGSIGAWWGVAAAAVPVLVPGFIGGDACVCAGDLCLSRCGISCAAAASACGLWAGHALAGTTVRRADFLGAAVVATGIGLWLCPSSGFGSALGATVGLMIATPIGARFFPARPVNVL